MKNKESDGNIEIYNDVMEWECFLHIQYESKAQRPWISEEMPAILVTLWA